MFAKFVPERRLFRLCTVTSVKVIPSVRRRFKCITTRVVVGRLPMVMGGAAKLGRVMNSKRCNAIFSFKGSGGVQTLGSQVIGILAYGRGRICTQRKEDQMLGRCSVRSFSRGVMKLCDLCKGSVRGWVVCVCFCRRT